MVLVKIDWSNLFKYVFRMFSRVLINHTLCVCKCVLIGK